MNLDPYVICILAFAVLALLLNWKAAGKVTSKPTGTSVLLERYDDAQVVGQTATFDMETGKTEPRGDLIRVTIKVRDPDGNVRLDFEWREETRDL
jgi:hypothetical protein